MKEERGPAFPNWAWAVAVGVVLILLGFLSFWAAVALGALTLLAGIFIRLGRTNKKI